MNPITQTNNLVKNVSHYLPAGKIVPCRWGLRCANGSACKYWHNNQMKVVPLCGFGQSCRNRGKTCFLSHDILAYDSSLICQYGLKCYKHCSKVHPIEANQAGLGKCYLLHRAVQCTNNLSDDLFKISVFDSTKILSPDPNLVFKINYGLNVTIERYFFIPNHTYQIFSNKKLGGGTLGLGNVQEEKLMMIFSTLQYLLYGFHYEKSSPLSNNLEYDPIVINTMVVAKDNSYEGCKSNLDSPHYGTNGLKIAHDKRVADSLYDPIDKPFPVKTICVAVPSFKDWSGVCYNDSVLQHVFYTLYKSLVTSIVANECDNQVSESIIHIGNIGCGVFGHNYNTIYILQHLAMSCAVSLINPQKKIIVMYHAYDEKTYAGLVQNAIPSLTEWMYSGKNIGTILSEIRQKQLQFPDTWAKKI